MTSIRKNSSPFSFRNFGGREPTGEEVRKELEKSHQYLQAGLDGLKFGDIGDTVTEGQAPFVTSGFSSIRTELVDGDSANAERLDSLEAQITDPATGLVAAFARISTFQQVNVTRNSAFARQLSVVQAQVGQTQASVTEERVARVNADGTVLASLTTEVLARISGDTTLQANITTEATARISADGTITASLTTEVAARISGDTTSLAAVTTEATARISADGNLSAKYTLTTTVSAGGVTVVTGMNITSAIGPGTNVSSVVFRAADFKIWNSSPDIGVPMFDISGSTVRLAGTLTVSTSGKVYIGTGTYGNTNTAWYVDSTGQMSLKDQFKWDGTTLDVLRISAINGTIGGFTIGSTDITATDFLLSTTGPRLRVGTAANERITMELVSSRSRLICYNSLGNPTVLLQGNDGSGLNNGFMQFLNSAGTNANITISAAGKISNGDGSVGSPCYSFMSDSDTGFFWNASGDFRAVSNGTTNFAFRAGANVTLVPFKLDNAFVAGAPAATGYITMQDSTGTTYKFLTAP